MTAATTTPTMPPAMAPAYDWVEPEVSRDSAATEPEERAELLDMVLLGVTVPLIFRAADRMWLEGLLAEEMPLLERVAKVLLARVLLVKVLLVKVLLVKVVVVKVVVLGKALLVVKELVVKELVVKELLVGVAVAEFPALLLTLLSFDLAVVWVEWALECVLVVDSSFVLVDFFEVEVSFSFSEVEVFVAFFDEVLVFSASEDFVDFSEFLLLFLSAIDPLLE